MMMCLMSGDKQAYTSRLLFSYLFPEELIPSGSVAKAVSLNLGVQSSRFTFGEETRKVQKAGTLLERSERQFKGCEC